MFIDALFFKASQFSLVKSTLELYWTAPELLRSSDEGRKTSNSSGLGKLKKKSVRMSAEGDIYAVAIILKEVFARNSPYSEYDDVSPKGQLL